MLAIIDGVCDENSKFCVDGGMAILNGDKDGEGLTVLNGIDSPGVAVVVATLKCDNPGVVAIWNCDPKDGVGGEGEGGIVMG